MDLKPHHHSLTELNRNLKGIACSGCGEQWVAPPIIGVILRAVKDAQVATDERNRLALETLMENFGWRVCACCGAWITRKVDGVTVEKKDWCIHCVATVEDFEVANNPVNARDIACWLRESRAIRSENIGTPLFDAAFALVESVPLAMGMPAIWTGEAAPASPAEIEWNVSCLPGTRHHVSGRTPRRAGADAIAAKDALKAIEKGAPR